MFVLTEITDLVRIPPHTFNIPIQHSITDELNKKLANKVIANLGLVITIWDLLDIKDGLLKPGDGGSYVEVQFRCVVWKPFVGEVLTGWVSECTPQGIKIRLEFFDEIFIPRAYLFEGCEFKPVEKAWVWKPDEETELFIDINEKIRFRVEQEIFVNIKPKSSNEAVGLEEPTNKAPPYAIMASCQTEGMGCVSWWD
ncbi:subunit of RNA polymerase [Spathaspora passalidarum NRRL Y-27907]|uniref:DNA-directed RNA polymerase subunit n=1 Tax=Spathaspora passalidarum (strain NRRL Y-27907 / 11-Y1) TaxID=619300 RepID=G3AFV2_SPAPN|nr:subunit of RNA polymerase [Spathaspora passalidarum NRRL Y-27907]EGW35092.1 subunit of RNA polymerase [Spathaspora passalidarum NRRL Y-27907]